MSDDAPERPGVARLVAALNVRRNAAVGFGTGGTLASALVLAAVTGPSGQYPPAYYVALGFVLTVGTGLLLTVAFTVLSAARLSRSL